MKNANAIAWYVMIWHAIIASDMIRSDLDHDDRDRIILRSYAFWIELMSFTFKFHFWFQFYK